MVVSKNWLIAFPLTVQLEGWGEVTNSLNVDSVALAAPALAPTLGGMLSGSRAIWIMAANKAAKTSVQKRGDKLNADVPFFTGFTGFLTDGRKAPGNGGADAPAVLTTGGLPAVWGALGAATSETASTAGNRVPQLEQNTRVSSFSVPQCWQARMIRNPISQPSSLSSAWSRIWKFRKKRRRFQNLSSPPACTLRCGNR